MGWKMPFGWSFLKNRRWEWGVMLSHINIFTQVFYCVIIISLINCGSTYAQWMAKKSLKKDKKW